MYTGIIVVCALLAAVNLIFPITAIIIGKVKLRRALRPIEYYPPRGYSPIDLAIKYYGFRANTHALFNPLMLYWAERGFITIEEDCKRGLKLTKLRELVPPYADTGRDVVADIEELDDGRPKKRKRKPRTNVAALRVAERIATLEDPRTELERKNFEAEKKLFDEIFHSGKTEFYTLAAEKAYESTNKNFMKSSAENARGERSHRTKILSRATFAVAALSSVIATIAVSIGSSVGPLLLAMIFPIVGMVAFRAIPNEDIMTIIKYPFFAVWGGAPLAAVLAISPMPISLSLGSVVLTAALTVSVLSGKIDIRTDSDLEIYGRICAFKTFLLEVEVDRLETLIEDDPNYYYNILPFCYILKITEKMKAKFDHVALDGPSWYLGDLRNTLMF